MVKGWARPVRCTCRMGKDMHGRSVRDACRNVQKDSRNGSTMKQFVAEQAAKDANANV